MEFFIFFFRCKGFIAFLFFAYGRKLRRTDNDIVNQFVVNVIKKSKRLHDKEFLKIKVQRQKFLKDKTTIKVEDYGAKGNGEIKLKKISGITETSASSLKKVRFLYSLVKYYKPASILELGTSVGLSAASMALATPDTKIVTVEGSEAIANLADGLFAELQINNVEIHVSTFDAILYDLLPRLSRPHIIFIDGNHTKDATIRYFEAVLHVADESSIVVFDDIYWSPGMKAAWDNITKHEASKVCINLYDVGIVFFKGEKVSEEICFF